MQPHAGELMLLGYAFRMSPGALRQLVTHDVDEAIELADRVIVLDEGFIVADVATDLPELTAARLARAFQLRAILLTHLGVPIAQPVTIPAALVMPMEAPAK